MTGLNEDEMILVNLIEIYEAIAGFEQMVGPEDKANIDTLTEG